ncbi:MAG: hypothetical protein HY302_15805 [Opitutae bacterium]|nr:hypothetical protein [Opitutae bacterium]
MNPRLNKLPFLLGDVALLAAAFLLAKYGPQPLSTGMVVAIACCVIIAAALGVTPFLADAFADERESTKERHDQMELQVKRLHAAAESLTRAAAQIKSVEEAVHKSAHAAETLPYRMQEKLAEFNEALAEKENSDHEALEQEVADLRAADSAQLKATADKIHKAAADWTALEAATRKQLAAAEAALAKIHAAAAAAASAYEAKLNAAVQAGALAATEALDAKLAEFKQGARPSRPAPAVHAPAAQLESAPGPVVVEAVSVESPAVAAATPEASVAPAAPAAVVEEPKPKKPRAPRKPKVEEQPLTDTTAPMPVELTPAAAAEPEPVISSDEDSAPASAAPAESSASSDGATRLLATAYIGIGNKLFLRGDGPGLSWDKGVPMQFVSIGKWGWATHDATAPFRAKLYKNDETTGMTGEISLAPGQHVEITALF